MNPLRKNETFWYLASPYTKYPGGPRAARILAEREAFRLMLARIPVFSPIVHTHSIAEITNTGGMEYHPFWMEVDLPFVKAASGLIALMGFNWEESFGMAEELKLFNDAGKPVVFMKPGKVPHELENV